MKHGMIASGPNANITLAEHALNKKPSQYMSFSDSPLASPTNAMYNDGGAPLLVDARKLKRSGVQIFSTEEIAADLRKFGRKNSASRIRANRAIEMITTIEGEVLVKGKVAGNFLRKPGPTHKAYIVQAENAARDLETHRNLAQTQHEVTSLKSSHARVRATGHVFRLVNVVGVVLSAGDIAYASHTSVKKGSVKPIAAESIRQAGGWGLGWAGFKTGCATGALIGIETGPGVFAACAIGGLFGGVAGYLGADWIADNIHENELGIPWMETNNW